MLQLDLILFSPKYAADHIRIELSARNESWIIRILVKYTSIVLSRFLNYFAQLSCNYSSDMSVEKLGHTNSRLSTLINFHPCWITIEITNDKYSINNDCKIFPKAISWNGSDANSTCTKGRHVFKNLSTWHSWIPSFASQTSGKH